MTYLISRANYDRCTEGMTEAQRAAFDLDFTPYPAPETMSPDGRIDLERVADAYVALRARETGTPPELTFTAVKTPWFTGWDVTGQTADLPYVWPKGAGKSSWRPPAPWQELGDGFFTAPADTPAPFYTPDPGPAPTITEQAAQEHSWWDWPGIFRQRRPVVHSEEHTEFVNDAVAGESFTDQSPFRRAWLNQWTPARPRDVLDDIMAWWRDFRRVTDLPGPQRIAAGQDALYGFRFAGRDATLKASDQVVANVPGIPIVADPDLPADEWQLVDEATGEVLHYGFISPEFAAQARAYAREYLDRARATVAELADRTGVPRTYVEGDTHEEFMDRHRQIEDGLDDI